MPKKAKNDTKIKATKAFNSANIFSLNQSKVEFGVFFENLTLSVDGIFKVIMCYFLKPLS